MKSKYLVICCVLGGSLLFCAPGGSEQGKGNQRDRQPTPTWPIFRGDAALSGQATGKLELPLRLRWTFKSGGPIQSSPVVGQGMVFIGSSDSHLYALDFNTGKQRWRFRAARPIEAPPLLLGDSVYVGDRDGFFYALQAADGKLRWKFKTGDKITGSANSYRVGTNSAPRILVGSHDFYLYCLDSRNGNLLWKYGTDNFINGAPAVTGKRAVFGGCDALLHVVDVVRGKRVAGIQAGAYIAASVALQGEYAYVGHYRNKLIKADLGQGRVLWEFGLEKGGRPFFSSPAVAGDVVLAGCRDRYLYCVDSANGRQRWRFRTRDQVDSSPVVCGSLVVCASLDGRIYVVDLNQGRQRWSYEIGSGLIGSPAVCGGRITIGAEDGKLYQFGGSG